MKHDSRLQFSEGERKESTETSLIQANKRKGKPPKAPPDMGFSPAQEGTASSITPRGNTAPTFTRSRLRFGEDEQTNPAVEKALHKAEKAAVKLDKAKSKLPTQKRIALAHATDAATGKAALRLRFDEKNHATFQSPARAAAAHHQRRNPPSDQQA